ncbi:K06975 [Mytilus edulis]|uniref:Protein NATD1 n=3 Tax=Mytilus TaxID=6548 RepID=A0A8B6HMU0_MYTGA|nr:K06975 [Mytilus edulis]VDI82160.1 uncharacterized protein MGAL_10B027557 [Mytilus galloprovincialis]
MKSVHAFRKCIQLTLIPRNHIQSIQKGHLSNAVIMEKTNNNLGNDTHRVITRSYSKKLHERKEDVKSKSETPLIIGHDKDDKEFYIKMNTDEQNKSNKKAILTYEWERPKFADLQHTFVPEEFRGHGVAKVLAETAFDYFVSEGATMRLSCSYLQKYALDNENPRHMSNISWD